MLGEALPLGSGLRVGVVGLGGLGGSGRVAHDVACGLAERGHFTVSLTCAESQFTPEVQGWVQHVPVRGPRTPQPAEDRWVQELAEDLERAVVEHRLGVLSVHYGVGLAEAAILARTRLRARGVGVRVTVTLHGTDVTTFSHDPEQARRLVRALGQADEVVAVSQWLADVAREYLPIVESPGVIDNSIDTEVFYPSARRRELGPAVLVHASNFRPVKRPLDAVEVLARLRERGVDARLEMIGDGPLRTAAESRAQTLGLSGEVEFLGPLSQPALADRLRRADLSLVTSESESFGLFALESMACGLLLSGWQCPGLLATLSSDPGLGEALLAPIGDFPGVVDRVEGMLSNAPLREKLGARCLALGQTRFTRARHLSAYQRLFEAEAKEPQPWPHDARI